MQRAGLRSASSQGHAPPPRDMDAYNDERVPEISIQLTLVLEASKSRSKKKPFLVFWKRSTAYQKVPFNDYHVSLRPAISYFDAHSTNAADPNEAAYPTLCPVVFTCSAPPRATLPSINRKLTTPSTQDQQITRRLTPAHQESGGRGRSVGVRPLQPSSSSSHRGKVQVSYTTYALATSW